ncbi:MAG: hypothetical protein WC025_01130 [Candidatus Magasanikbacteria bacterium]
MILEKQVGKEDNNTDTIVFIFCLIGAVVGGGLAATFEGGLDAVVIFIGTGLGAGIGTVLGLVICFSVLTTLE